ncbi:hypothetical protein JOF57_001970 [Mycolicibacterium lutetiense]|nr:hypothetical protein [Mycolicibacterium lutetiense]
MRHNVDVLELVLGVTRTPAMQRAGLNFDAPGMLINDPAEVAREGLDHLGRAQVMLTSDAAIRDLINRRAQ